MNNSMLDILQETIDGFLKAAQKATNENDRLDYLLLIKQTARDLENYYKTEAVSEEPKSLPKPVHPPANHRREAILAQRERKTA